MSGKNLNPIVLLQLMMQYNDDSPDESTRIFMFNRNYRIRIHHETDEESKKRKSRLSSETKQTAKKVTKELLKKSLKGQLGKVWVDPKMKKIAVPLEMATGNSGYGVLPTGSRIDIPEGQFIRAFTYWWGVNDIDISVFAITLDGRQEEFSWRNMWNKQSHEIAFSGDQTSGYEGGCEYFDIDFELFHKNHPDFRYLIFCNNVYSGIDFSKCNCFAGFMIREQDPHDVPIWKGERDPKSYQYNGRKIFDPKTVATSFRITADTTFCHLFAIDLETREMIWLNMARKDRSIIAGNSPMDFLLRVCKATDVFSMYDLYTWAGEQVDSPEEADIIVGDDEIKGLLREDQEWIHSWDFEKMLKLLNPGS